jgi:phospholipid-binding lipoprotein MlaA
VGIIGDIYTQPLNYVIEFKYNVAIRAYDIVNSTSLTIGEYEDLKRAALDPYVAMRDAYYQYRLNKIKE